MNAMAVRRLMRRLKDMWIPDRPPRRSRRQTRRGNFSGLSAAVGRRHRPRKRRPAGESGGQGDQGDLASPVLLQPCGAISCREEGTAACSVIGFNSLAVGTTYILYRPISIKTRSHKNMKATLTIFKALSDQFYEIVICHTVLFFVRVGVCLPLVRTEN